MALYQPTNPPFWCLSTSPISDNMPPSDLLSNPPRPPNAWILYRSDKLKTLTPPPPGARRRPQAEISKEVSAMWKVESASVRAYYERLSDIKKAEHQALYPTYRFRPLKRADREKLRAEKVAERERQRAARKTRSRRHAASLSPPSSHPTLTAEPLSDSACSSPKSLSSSFTVNSPVTPPPPSPSPSLLYPTSPTTPSIPLLIAPRPGPPHRTDWNLPCYDKAQDDNGALQPPLQNLDGIFYPEYLHVAYPTISGSPSGSASTSTSTSTSTSMSMSAPLGWSPSDPSPPTDSTFSVEPHHQLPQASHAEATVDPLQATLTATSQPCIFEFDMNALFDGSREVQVSFGSNESNAGPFDDDCLGLGFEQPNLFGFSPDLVMQSGFCGANKTWDADALAAYSLEEFDGDCKA